MTETAVIETPRIEAEQKAVTLLDQAKALVIVTNEDRLSTEEMIQAAKKLEDEIFAYLDPPRAKAYEDYKYHKQRLDDALKPVQDARKAFKQKCIGWDSEQERIRKDEERKAQEEARKREEEAQIAAALEAEQSGDKETAEAILAEPVQVAPVVVPKTAPQASRLSAGREVWNAEVTNLMELVKTIAAGKAPLNLVVANMTALNGMARSLKSGMNYPGVKAVCKKV